MGPVRCPYLLVLAGLIAGSGLLEGAQTPLQAGLSQAASERQAFAIVQVEAAGEPYAAPGLRLVRPGQHPATASQGPSLRIRFSLPTALADVTGALVCEPPVALAWSHAWQEDDFTIGVPAALTAKGSYRLRVTRELVDRARSGRLAPGDTPFEWAGALTRLAFVEVGDLVERRSRQLVHVKLRGVERLLVDAVPVPLSALLRHDLPPVLPSQVLRPRREDDESAKDQALETLSSADTEPESLSARWAAAESSVAGELATTAGPFAGLFGTASPAERQLFVEPPDSSRERRTSLPLAWRQGAARGGPCLVRVRDADFPASAGTGFLLVQVTDLSVAFKRSESALSIWVTSLQSGTVIPGARIFLGLRDHRLLAAGTTGEGGLLALEADAGLDSLDLSGRSAVLGRSRLDLARLVQIIAVTEHDLAFVLPEQHGLKAPVQTRRFKTPDRAVWQAHVFTERGVYRPGDSIRYKVTIRQFDGGVAAAPRTTDGPPPSCAVFLKSPRDQSPVKQRVTLSSFGTAAGVFPLRSFDPVGEWTLEVKDSTETNELGSTSLRVEEFVPLRHEVRVSFQPSVPATAPTTAGAAPPGPSVRATVLGQYYGGGVLKHAKVRWRAFLESQMRPLENVPGFVWGTRPPEDEARRFLEAGEAMLDPGGRLQLELPLSADVLDGQVAVTLEATVLDFDGRAATGSGAYSVRPPYRVGISDHPAIDASAIAQELAAVVAGPPDGQRLQEGKLTVELLRPEWTMVMGRSRDGDVYYHWGRVMTRQSEQEVPLEDGVARLAVPLHGDMEVRFSFLAPDGNRYRSTTFLDRSYDDYYDDDAPGVEPGRLRLSLDRREYLPGETARLDVRTPRPAASYWVTVEREKVLWSRRVVLPPGQSTLELPIDPAFAPCAYVSVLAVHPREGFGFYATDLDSTAPALSRGYAELRVRRQHGGLTVELEGAGDSVTTRPGKRHSIGVRVRDREGHPVRAEVALAVVDEGILALTGYRSPELGSLFDVRLPLRVATGDLRAALTLQTPMRSVTVRSLTGGDGGPKGVRLREWFDPVAFYQPDLLTDAAGEAHVEFTLPDAVTTYRVYALACDPGEKHGGVSRPLAVTQPFFIEPGLPRFLTLGDRGRFLVAAFNQSDGPGEVTLQAFATGGLEVSAPTTACPVAAGAIVHLPVEVRATGVGPARVELTARMGAHADATNRTLSVRPRHILRTQFAQGVLKGAQGTLRLPLPLEAATDQPALARFELHLSTSESLLLGGPLRHLLDYPYGCVEQTSSGLLALAVLSQLVADHELPGLRPESTEPFLQAGMERLFKMQSADGGLGFWSGRGPQHPWGSAYAALALSLAQDAGHAVPEGPFGALLGYLESLFWGEKNRQPMARALARFVLARHGRKPTGLLKGLSRDKESLTADCLTLLAAARAGDRDGACAALEDLVPGNPRLRKTPRPSRRPSPAPPSGDAGDEGREDRQTDHSPDESDSSEDSDEASDNSPDQESAEEFDEATFGSGMRDRAILLLTLQTLAPEHPLVEKLRAEAFQVLYRGSQWGTTQENAWCLAALYQPRPEGPGPAEQARLRVSVAGAGFTTAVVLSGPRGGSVTLPAVSFLGTPSVKLSRPGGPKLFYRLEGTYPWRGPGPVTPSSPLGRSYRRLEGPGPVRVGDLVEVSLQMELGEDFHFVALTDPLPAGLIAVNPAFRGDARDAEDQEDRPEPARPGWYYELSPSHVERRDDRVFAASSWVWQGTYLYRYLARATCEGTFGAPPACLEPMYEPGKALYSSETTLTILPGQK